MIILINNVNKYHVKSHSENRIVRYKLFNFVHRVWSIFLFFINNLLKPNFSKTTEQKLNLNKVKLSLPEIYLTVNFCHLVLENFEFKVWLKYGSDFRDKFGNLTQLKCKSLNIINK